MGLVTACHGDKPKATMDAGPVPARSIDAEGGPEAQLPMHATPSLAEHSGAYLGDVESCGACHPDAFAQQQASAHAFASFNNPVYRAAVETLRGEEGHKPSLVCAGCHDLALLADEAMERPVAASDPRAHKGVTCRLCHGVASAVLDGNGHFTLTATPLPIPADGDQESLQRHKRAVKPAPVSELCGGCHQSFLSRASGNEDVLNGQNELRAWADSAYAGQGASRIDSVATADCVDCHMPRVPAPLGDVAAKNGRIASHQSLGGHTWLAAMRTDAQQLREQRAVLSKAVTLDVIRAPHGDQELAFDVVIRNVGVGHRFPGGVRDAANTVVRVTVRDAKGRVILQSAKGDHAHVLRSYMADVDGRLLNARETHRFAASIADHTIAPRDVAVVRYRGERPKEQSAHTVEVELVHRSRSEAVAKAACTESRSRRGKAYTRAAASLEGQALDGCVPQPESVIASTTRILDTSASSDFQRMYEHGLGLLHEMQERVASAEVSLQAALSAAQSDEQRAMALVALGQVASRQGRIDDSLKHFDLAAQLISKHPAIAASRGDAFARVWRWTAAAAAYQDAVALAPGNASLWRRYALALGSSGEREKAMRAAQRGLQLSPRNADLLRVQALALRETHESSLAMESYLAHRGPDNRGAIIKRCIDRSAVCAREALPVHEHALLSPGTKLMRVVGEQSEFSLGMPVSGQ